MGREARWSSRDFQAGALRGKEVKSIVHPFQVQILLLRTDDGMYIKFQLLCACHKICTEIYYYTRDTCTHTCMYG